MSEFKCLQQHGWIFHLGQEYRSLDENNVGGKWMYFFADIDFAKKNM